MHGQSRQASCCSLACVLACCVSVGISKFEITVFPRRCASPPLGCPPPIRKGGHKARRNPEVAVGAARSAAWYSTSGGRVALEGLGLQPVAVPAQYWTPIPAGAVTRPGECASFCSLRSTAHAGTERVGGSWAGRPVRTAERWHWRCLGCSRGGPSRGCGLGTRLDIGGPGREGGGGSGRVRGLAWIQVELKRTRGAGKGDRLDGGSGGCDFTWLPHNRTVLYSRCLQLQV